MKNGQRSVLGLVKFPCLVIVQPYSRAGDVHFYNLEGIFFEGKRIICNSCGGRDCSTPNPPDAKYFSEEKILLVQFSMKTSLDYERISDKDKSDDRFSK